ncbi:hypothetical protein K491DRAFT_668935 [Lophiostoma macrostomum CBS 122681]|uniref:Zn(2)-C6 fungal-type domain-containing protein n=1 Tax=Lophiostoma macrostomum CBS 122681 TaxID=1314788 RepID=A0A6A6SQZ3_9PLEO|nr:hypothetical protein K491DRAFT_668935 [Lophiostoma macrostomum CBS 122681]
MPSKSRGLRTSTGCLTCRKRRVKCDETRPRCQNCIRVSRQCTYAQPNAASRRTPRPLSTHEHGHHRTSSTSSLETASLALSMQGDEANQADMPQPWMPFSLEHSDSLSTSVPMHDDALLFDDNLLLSLGEPTSPSLGPFEWFDLLAQDAITTITNIQETSNQAPRWNLDKFSLSRRQTPRQSPTPQLEQHMQSDNPSPNDIQTPASEPWNTAARITLSPEDKVFFEHFVTVVGPILDLFDPEKHFANIVPHLALHNIGLMKSLLAVGACHMALEHPADHELGFSATLPPDTPTSSSSIPNGLLGTSRMADQYYYETLHWLAQNMLYPSYTSSHEILATAIMISTYEMLGSFKHSVNDNWGRHLRGAFWIQRNQDNDGETNDGLRRAVWWAWVRQDIWAALRENRPAMTIWQPKKALSQLTADELSTRIVYIAAKCIQFAATAKENDISGYIDAGERLMLMLEQWKQILPSSFEPIPLAASQSASTPASSNSDVATQFQPIWIHPPSHAAAIQMYHFSRIIVLLNQPSTGGLSKYQLRGKMLRESMSTICGIAIAPQSQNLPSAFVDFQAVYAGMFRENVPSVQNLRR